MARYPKAIWTPASNSNEGGAIGKITLGVMHIEQGSEAGTNSWFKNPSAQVSAHFGNAKDGSLYQFVDTSRVAWAEMGYNSDAISIEHEGLSGQSLTPEQIATDVGLYEWLHTTHGIPLVRTVHPSIPGWIGHGELGYMGGDHPDCPGEPVLCQIPHILAGAVNKIKTAAPTAEQLSSHGYVLVKDLVEAQNVIRNHGTLLVWNGLGFSNSPAHNPPGTHEYAGAQYIR